MFKRLICENVKPCLQMQLLQVLETWNLTKLYFQSLSLFQKNKLSRKFFKITGWQDFFNGIIHQVIITLCLFTVIVVSGILLTFMFNNFFNIFPALRIKIYQLQTSLWNSMYTHSKILVTNLYNTRNNANKNLL